MNDELIEVVAGRTVFHSPRTYGMALKLRRDELCGSRCGHAQGSVVDAGVAIRSGLSACKRCFPNDPVETWDINASTGTHTISQPSTVATQPTYMDTEQLCQYCGTDCRNSEQRSDWRQRADTHGNQSAFHHACQNEYKTRMAKAKLHKELCHATNCAQHPTPTKWADEPTSDPHPT